MMRQTRRDPNYALCGIPLDKHLRIRSDEISDEKSYEKPLLTELVECFLKEKKYLQYFYDIFLSNI